MKGFTAVNSTITANIACAFALSATACATGTANAPLSPAETSRPSANREAAVSNAVPEAKRAIEQGNFSKAIESLKAAQANGQRDAEVHFYLGVALAGNGQGKDAQQSLSQALELQPGLTDASLNLSALMLDEGEFAGAKQVADRGLQRAPEDLGLLQNRAMAQMGLGDSTGAAATLRTVLERLPADEELRFLRAEALVDGQQAEAKRELKRLLTSNNVQVLASAGDLLGRLKEWDLCISAFDRALTKQQKAQLHVQRGLCRHGKKDEAGALEDFRAAVQAEPEFAQAHFYLGHSLLKAKAGSSEAKSAFKKTMELAGSDSRLGKAAARALQNL